MCTGILTIPTTFQHLLARLLAKYKQAGPTNDIRGTAQKQFVVDELLLRSNSWQPPVSGYQEMNFIEFFTPETIITCAGTNQHVVLINI